MAELNSYALYHGASYPLESDVVNTAPTYGDAINVLNGTLDPGAAGTMPDPADVRLGTAVGETTGLLALPSVADVRSGTTFDAVAVQQTGTLDLPAEADVQFGVAFDNATKNGMFRWPDETVVLDGIPYGTNSEFIGTFDASADNPIFPNVNDVRQGKTFGTVDNPTQYSGNYEPAAQADVKLNQQYGSLGAEFTGSYVPSTGECDQPAVGDVRVGIQYANGALVGNYEPAEQSSVLLGVEYGASGVEYVGTYSCDTGVPGEAEWVEK